MASEEEALDLGLHFKFLQCYTLWKRISSLLNAPTLML